jgi:hypothetical protein
MTPNFERLDRAFNRIIHPEPGDPGFYFGRLNADKNKDGFYNHHASASCGSFCCALGGLPLHEKEWKWNVLGYPVMIFDSVGLTDIDAEYFFHLDKAHISYLFYPLDEDDREYELTGEYDSEPLYSDATPQQVYDNYIRFKEAYQK